jgi:hypothetical protein
MNSGYTFTAYFNTERDAMWKGYMDGDALIPSTVYVDYPVAGTGVTHAASNVFGMLNMDDRLNGQVERSLSVGDVVCIDGLDRTWLVVEGMGFKNIDAPNVSTPTLA